MPVCPHCKQEIRADSEYCGDCGKKVSFSGSKNDTGKSPPGPAGSKPAGKKGSPLLKIFLGCGCLGIILLIIAIAVIYIFFKPNLLELIPSLKNILPN
jgi:hypothetical protein